MKLTDLTLYQAFKRAADANPNATAIYYFSTKISYGKLDAQIERMASILQNDYFVSKGDTVLISLPNIPQTIILLYAVNKIGAICNMVHPHTPMAGMQKFYNESNCKVAFLLDRKVYKQINDYKKFDGNIVLCDIQTYFFDKALRTVYDLASKAQKRALSTNTRFNFYRKFKTNKTPSQEIVLTHNEPCVLLHSASTTGESKTIMLSSTPFNYTAELTPEIMCMSEEELIGKPLISILPSFHGFGLCMSMHAPLVNRMGIVLIPKYRPSQISRPMRRIKVCSCICAVPTVYKTLISDNGFAKNKYIKNLCSCFSGGDSLSSVIKENFDNLMVKHKSKCRLFEGYGLTEVLSVSAVNTHAHHKYGSVGYPLKGVSFRILDDDGNILEPNKIGEISIKSKTSMIGYYNNPESSKNVYEDGYLRTGDVGYIDEDGFVYFVSRKKRVIKVSGVAVFPNEIESVISRLSFVKNCCAIEIPDEKTIHAVKVFVVASSEDKEKIIDQCKKNLISWAIPKEIEFVDKLPYTKYHKVNFEKLQLEENKKRGI